MAPESVSVVIPAYNAERFIGEAIESVLAQTHPPFEVVVVDDGSTDATATVARGYPGVTLIQRENGGIGAARNTGVAAATGDWLAFLDADDTWPPDRLSALLAEAEACGADAVFGTVVQFGEGRQDTAPAHAQLPGAGIFRRTAYDRVGLFREDVKVGEFVDWWARATEAGLTAASIPGVTLRRRIHATNTGITQAGSRIDYTRVLRAALERRRQQQ